MSRREALPECIASESSGVQQPADGQSISTCTSLVGLDALSTPRPCSRSRALLNLVRSPQAIRVIARRQCFILAIHDAHWILRFLTQCPITLNVPAHSFIDSGKFIFQGLDDDINAFFCFADAQDPGGFSQLLTWQSIDVCISPLRHFPDVQHQENAG